MFLSHGDLSSSFGSFGCHFSWVAIFGIVIYYVKNATVIHRNLISVFFVRIGWRAWQFHVKKRNRDANGQIFWYKSTVDDKKHTDIKEHITPDHHNLKKSFRVIHNDQLLWSCRWLDVGRMCGKWMDRKSGTGGPTRTTVMTSNMHAVFGDTREGIWMQY